MKSVYSSNKFSCVSFFQTSEHFCQTSVWFIYSNLIFLCSQQINELVIREVEILHACQSPYVVSFMESWREDLVFNGKLTPCQILTMEMCDSSLRQEIMANPRGLKLARVKSITAQILCGLAFVHR